MKSEPGPGDKPKYHQKDNVIYPAVWHPEALGEDDARRDEKIGSRDLMFTAKPESDPVIEKTKEMERQIGRVKYDWLQVLREHISERTPHAGIDAARLADLQDYVSEFMSMWRSLHNEELAMDPGAFSDQNQWTTSNMILAATMADLRAAGFTVDLSGKLVPLREQA